MRAVTSVLYKNMHMQTLSSCVQGLVQGASTCMHNVCGHRVGQQLFMHVQHLYELAWTYMDMNQASCWMSRVFVESCAVCGYPLLMNAGGCT